MGQRCAAKPDSDHDRSQHDDCAEHSQHAAPAKEIADQAGHRSTQEIAGHGAGQRAPDRDLTLFGTHEIAGQPQRDRKHAA